MAASGLLKNKGTGSGISLLKGRLLSIRSRRQIAFSADSLVGPMETSGFMRTKPIRLQALPRKDRLLSSRHQPEAILLRLLLGQMETSGLLGINRTKFGG